MEADGPAAAGSAAWPRRHWRWLIGLGAGIALLLAIVAAVCWHFSSAVLVPDHSSWPEDVTVEELEPGRIVLSRSEDTLRPGVYGLVWQAGHAVLGAPVASDEEP